MNYDMVARCTNCGLPRPTCNANPCNRFEPHNNNAANADIDDLFDVVPPLSAKELKQLGLWDEQS